MRDCIASLRLARDVCLTSLDILLQPRGDWEKPSFAPALHTDELARPCKFECTNICTMKSSIASLGGLKPRGMAWRWRRRRRRSFFLRTKWKLHEERSAREREREREKRGEGERRKKDLIRFPLEFTWLENKGSRIDRAESESSENSWNAFPPPLDHWIFHGTPVSWKIEISFSTAAKSAGVNRDGSRNK